MIVHNTTYSITPTTENDWILWMKERHLPRVENIQGVVKCQLLKLLTEIESDGVTYTVQVEINNLSDAELFLTEHDPTLQTEITNAFPEQVIYFQTLLKIM